MKLVVSYAVLASTIGGSAMAGEGLIDQVAGREPTRTWNNADGSRTKEYISDDGKEISYQRQSRESIDADKQMNADITVAACELAIQVGKDIYNWWNGPMPSKAVVSSVPSKAGDVWDRDASAHSAPAAGTTAKQTYTAGQGARDDAQVGMAYAETADERDGRALYDRGCMYATGQGVSRNDELAIALFRRAADMGFIDAQDALGDMYENGIGVTRDHGTAEEWHRKATEARRKAWGAPSALPHSSAEPELTAGQPHSNARDPAGLRPQRPEAAEAERAYAKACCFATGNGVPRDDVEAVRWYIKAAEMGHAAAQCELGCRYRTGMGVKEDRAEAAKWIRRAADQGDSDAKKLLGE